MFSADFFICVVLMALFNLFQPDSMHNSAIGKTYSDFISEVNHGEVRDVVIQGHTIFGQLKNGLTFSTNTPEDPSLVKTLMDDEVRVIAKPENSAVDLLSANGPLLAVSSPLLTALAIVLPAFPHDDRPLIQVAYSDFFSEVNHGRVRDVLIVEHTIWGQLDDGRRFRTYAPEDPSLVKALADKDVRITTVDPLRHRLLSWFPWILLALFDVFSVVIPLWIICGKMGLSREFLLVTLLPFIGVLIVLAFARWPNQQNRQEPATAHSHWWFWLFLINGLSAPGWLGFRIARRAGLSRPVGICLGLPVVGLIILWMSAFKEWPLLKSVDLGPPTEVRV